MGIEVYEQFCVAGTESTWGYLVRVKKNLRPLEGWLYKNVILHFTEKRIGNQKFQSRRAIWLIGTGFWKDFSVNLVNDQWCEAWCNGETSLEASPTV